MTQNADSVTNYSGKLLTEAEKVFVPEVFLPDGKYNAKDIHWLPSYIEDQLYLQMCECDKTVKVKGSQDSYMQLNKYYYEAEKYTALRSVGDFEGKNAKYKPIFHVELEDFSPRLKAELAGLPKQSVHWIVTGAVFRIFRVRCKMAFYQYIENERLRWEFV